MSKKRCRFYIDVSAQRSRSMWITKIDPIKFHYSILLIDCLPNDTLLSALLRDGRIVVSKVKYCQLLYKDNSVVTLTDKVNSYHDQKFVCSVGDSPQVSDNVWKEALALQHTCNNVPIEHTVDSIPSSESRICSPRTENPVQNERLDNSGPTPEVGNISPLANNIMDEIYNKWQTLLTDLFDLELQPKTSAKGRKETMRRNKLDKFAKPFLQEYHVDNTKGTPFIIMQKFMNYAYSVGILVKDGRPYGTCFRVGPKFVLTNRHVTNMAGLSTGSCSGASVVFNYIEQCSNDNKRCKVQEIRHSHDQLDYSVLALEPLDDSEFPPGLESLICLTTKKSTVSIIGHPGGDPKTFAIRCPIVSPKQNKVTYYLKFNPNPTGDADYSKVSDPARATYRTDFDYGSSGSPGFDQNGKLIVMHTCGYPLYPGSESVLEQGIRMTAIYRDLKQNKPDLFREIFPQDLSDAEWPEPEQPMDWS
ncbi:serine protease FAM111A-like [Branchiostoma floridae x Branchiostoma belcheri]